MSAKPLPPPPDFGEKPPKSAWTLVLAGMAFVFILAVLSFITMFYFTPVIVLFAVIFALIGLQYLIWGWLFERIYRQGNDQADK